ncbi:MAG: transglutaminase-like cysteine peptidase [Campylobacterota bacterium]|nr:transglutaminase-like cysteine peptidase [Campylobacterota bacterium]
MKRLILLFVVLTLLLAEPYITKAILEAIEKKYGLEAKNRFTTLNATLKHLNDKSDLEKLKGVNDFYNKVAYASDLKNWHINDYWATPFEFLGRDMGDCEDYVISKYFALRYLGMPSEKLYFSYVKSLKYRQAHMVLTYFETPKSIPLVLDNYEHKILLASKRRDLIPVYNFNGDSLFRASKKGKQGKPMQKTDKTHKKWDILIEDIKRNKI